MFRKRERGIFRKKGHSQKGDAFTEGGTPDRKDRPIVPGPPCLGPGPSRPITPPKQYNF